MGHPLLMITKTDLCVCGHARIYHAKYGNNSNIQCFYGTCRCGRFRLPMAVVIQPSLFPKLIKDKKKWILIIK